MKRTPNYKLQAIVENKKPWPWIGNAYVGANGAITVQLDRGVKLELPDGTKLAGGKLYLREPARRNDTPEQAPSAEPSVGITADAAQYL